VPEATVAERLGWRDVSVMKFHDHGRAASDDVAADVIEGALYGNA
jgi:hypothetical protein